MIPRVRTALLLLSALLPACARTPEPATSVPAECADLPAVAWDGWTRGFFLNYCTSCHSSRSPDRHGAPAGLDFDTEDQVRAARDTIRTSVLESRTMPVGGGLLTDDEVLLGIWLDCTAG